MRFCFGRQTNHHSFLPKKATHPSPFDNEAKSQTITRTLQSEMKKELTPYTEAFLLVSRMVKLRILSGSSCLGAVSISVCHLSKNSQWQSFNLK